jgi:hypothetical protein
MVIPEGLRSRIESSFNRALGRLSAPADLEWRLLRPVGVAWDASANTALIWSARSGKDAMELARALAGALAEERETVARCALVPPGLVNFRIADRVLMDAALSYEEGEDGELPLLPPGHPLEAGPPFLRRLRAIVALGACPLEETDAERPEARRLLAFLAGFREAGGREAGPAGLLGELMSRFESCHRAGVLTPDLCRAASREARIILRHAQKEGPL